MSSVSRRIKRNLAEAKYGVRVGKSKLKRLIEDEDYYDHNNKKDVMPGGKSKNKKGA